MANSKNRPWNNSSKESDQSGGWGNLPANLRPLADTPGERNPMKWGEIPVLVSVQAAELGDLNNRVWTELQAKLVAAGGEMVVSEDELLRYFATAIYARVMWVNRSLPARGFRPNDLWALPVAMHMVISAIGEVEKDGITYRPRWIPPADGVLLSVAEWEDITRRLLALEPFGLRFVKALELSERGVDKVMTLIRVDEPAETFFYAYVPPHALEALIAAVLGIRRTDVSDMSGFPLDMIPTYRLRGSWVLGFMRDFARMNEHRDVA